MRPTVAQFAPASHEGNLADVVLVQLVDASRKTDGHDVWLYLERRLELQQRDVVFECARVVISMHNHSLNRFGNGF